MEIKVGSKWKHSDVIYEILENYNDDVLVITKNKGDRKCVFKDWFESVSTPYIEFEWRIFRNIKIDFIKSYGVEETIGQYINDNYKVHDIKQYELLYNYNRYRKLVDTVEFENWVWYIFKGGIEKVHKCDMSALELTFSTKQHAQAFLQLAKDNGAL